MNLVNQVQASLNSINDSSAVSLKDVNSHKFNYKVIVKDIFTNDETGKSKALNVSQDKTHSAHSRKSADLYVLDCLEKKAVILWPKMCDDEAWATYEGVVMPKVLQSSLSISQTMSLLQDEILIQAATLFCVCTQRVRHIGSYNRRTLLSIKLVNLSGICKSEITELEKERETEKKRWKANLMICLIDLYFLLMVYHLLILFLLLLIPLLLN